MKSKQSRRDFLATTSKVIAGVGLLSQTYDFGALGWPASSRSKVVLARSDAVVNERNICSPKLVRVMFDRMLQNLTGQTDVGEAWRTLGLTAADTVAVKLNCCTWTLTLAPHRELVDALCSSLSRIIPANRIILYDKTTAQLQNGGFQANRSAQGVRCFGNDEGGGYDSQQRLTRIVTDTATKLINLASLKCVESDFGLSFLFKNHIGSLIDADMPKCHGNPDFLAEVQSLPSIRKKTLLNMGDGLRATYRRGTPWYWGGIIMGLDPVACEQAALQVVNSKRASLGIQKLRTPGHLVTAELKYGLGTCDPNRVDIVDVSR